MVLCATAWMLSAGYITLHKRHIAINVLYLMAGDRGKWYLDLFAYVVGVIALWLLADDAIVRAILVNQNDREDGLCMELAPAIGAENHAGHRGADVSGAAACQYASSFCLIAWKKSGSGGSRTYFHPFNSVTGAFYFGETDSFFGSINHLYASVGSVIDPSSMLDMREMGIASASLLIVGLMVALMMTGMPLGIVTLIVSILSALFYFGYGGLYLVSTNAFGLLEKYPLITVPLFVLMASILERAGVAEDLFDAMSILLVNCAAGLQFRQLWLR